MSFDTKYVNKIITPSGSSLNVRETPTVTAKALVVLGAGSPAGRSTGTYLKMTDGDWLQVFLYDAVKKSSGKEFGYVRRDVITISEPPATSSATPSASETQSMLSELNASDRKLFTKLVSLYRMLQSAEKSGQDVSTESAKYKVLIKNYADRQSQFKNNSVFAVKDKMTELNSALWSFGTPSFAAFFGGYISSFISGIGAIPIAIADFVIAGAVTLTIYLLIKGMLTQSKLDNAWSDDLDKTLQKKLTTAEYAKLSTERDTLLKKAYSQGKSDASVFGDLKGIVWGVAGAIAIWKIVPLLEKSK